MGQAKQRGSRTARIEQSKARTEALKPEKIICNYCKAYIKDIQSMDSRGMEGITAVFSGSCECGHSTLAVIGEPDAAAEAMIAFEAFMGEEGILGSQAITNQRVGQAKAMQQLAPSIHVFINETRTENVLLDQRPCAECQAEGIPDVNKNEVLEAPVRHGLQYGTCSQCGASHFIASARTKADCVKLEPVVDKIRTSFGAARPS